MEETLRYAAVICGKDTADETLTALAQAAESCLALRLREGVTAEDCGKAFPLAAAAMAAEAYLAAQAGGVSAFTAGSLSLSLEESRDGFTRSALNLLGPWLRDGGFAFRGVPVWNG